MSDEQLEQGAVPAPPKNPLLERIRMPGETYTLPSKGLLYSNDELAPDVKNGEVHILPMTAMEEILMRSPDKLFSGGAITDIFSRCIPQVQKPLEMFAKDVDFLLICLRKVSYGPEIEVTFQHDCKDAKEHSYVIPIDHFIDNTRGIDPTKVGSKFTCKLPNGQNVELRPIRYRDVVSALQTLNEIQSTQRVPDVKEVQQNSIRTLLNVIDNVDGHNDREMIREWLTELSPGFTNKIKETIEDINNWGPVFSKPVRCKDCGEEIDVATPLNPMAFFMRS